MEKNREKEKDILFLCQYFYPEYVSSATLPYDTALALAKEGFLVDALCGYPKEYSLKKNVLKKENVQNIEINRVHYFQVKRKHFLGRLLNFFSFTIAVAMKFRKLKKYKVIIVYSNPPILPIIAVFAKIVYKVKIIFISYDVYPEIAEVTKVISKKSMLSKGMRLINKKMFLQFEKVIALSEEMKLFFLNNRPITEKEIEIIPNWYEDQEIKSDLKNLPFPNAENSFLVSYFGNLGVCQDLETIEKGMIQLKEEKQIHFLFAGHGNKMQSLQETVKNENLKNVTVCDFLHGEEFKQSLKRSDCFIVSLVEGLSGLCVPSKTYSYMMAGKPVIAIIDEETEIARDLKENNAGYVVRAGEVNQFTKAIKALELNKEKRNIMGKNCRKVYEEKYTKEKCIGKYVEMVRKILKEARHV